MDAASIHAGHGSLVFPFPCRGTHWVSVCSRARRKTDGCSEPGFFSDVSSASPASERSANPHVEPYITLGVSVFRRCDASTHRDRFWRIP